MKNWAIASTVNSGRYAPVGKSSCFLLAAVLFALLFLRPALSVEASSSLLIPYLRLERITRLAQTYRPTSLPAYPCGEFSTPPKLDGDLSEWPAATEANLVALQSASHKVSLRFAWDEDGLYLAVEVGAAPGENLSGDLMNLNLTNAGVGGDNANYSFVLSASDAGLQLQPLSPAPVSGRVGKPEIVSVSGPEGRRGEAKIAWDTLTSFNPFSDWLLISLQALPPALPEAPPAAAPKRFLLMLQPDPSGGINGNLGLDSDPTGANSLTGHLYLRSPKPREVKLRLQIIRQKETNGEEEIVRIAQGLNLEQGVSAFRLSWYCGEEPAGNYLLRAVVSEGNKELFSRQIPFPLTPGLNRGQ
jgi:hypothetical protein